MKTSLCTLRSSSLFWPLNPCSRVRVRVGDRVRVRVRVRVRARVRVRGRVTVRDRATLSTW